MADFRLSQRARDDLIDIYFDGAEKFGRYQAEAYFSGLERSFGLIADFPMIGVSADELVPGLRRFRFQSHVIFYTMEAGHVFIRAIVHGRQQARPALFE